MHIKIKEEDKWFSLYIRARDSWTCQRCSKRFVPYTLDGDNSHLRGLHCSHCFTRGGMSVRFDEDNCKALCYGCHSYLDSHPDEKYEFWASRMGEREFALLRAAAHEVVKMSKSDKKEIGKFYKMRFLGGINGEC